MAFGNNGANQESADFETHHDEAFGQFDLLAFGHVVHQGNLAQICLRDDTQGPITRWIKLFSQFDGLIVLKIRCASR